MEVIENLAEHIGHTAVVQEGGLHCVTCENTVVHHRPVTEELLSEILRDNPYFGAWEEWLPIAYNRIPVLPRMALAHLYGRHDDRQIRYQYCVLCQLLRPEPKSSAYPIGAWAFPEPPVGMRWAHPADGGHSVEEGHRFDCGHWFLLADEFVTPQPESLGTEPTEVAP